MRLSRQNVTADTFVAVTAGLCLAGFVVAHGVPTLRHDWNWPIDRAASLSFLETAASGWVTTGFGSPNAHPTAYFAVLPAAFLIWIVGPLTALALFTFATGYACARAAAALAAVWKCPAPAVIGVGLFATFNPWVYNEVVAGHLTMVLAYAGLFGLLSEILAARGASAIRLALWLALVSLQLQFLLLAMALLTVFGLRTRKWLPSAAGLLFALPSIVGVIAEHRALVTTPYTPDWQINQSVWPAQLIGLGGYFTGYADRLGIVATVAAWAVFVLAAIGIVPGARRMPATIWTPFAVLAIFAFVCGAHGLLAAPYLWIVRNLPESGVFRELYDLVGPMIALLTLLASAAMAWRKELAYAGACVGVVALGVWLVAPPSGLWVGAGSYPHPSVNAASFTRFALLPAFQPLGLRAGGGSGAEPDAYERLGGAAPLNEYYPTYPVDMALARYEQTGDVSALRGLGVGTIVERPWLVSLANGTIGLAARDIAASVPVSMMSERSVRVREPVPLVSECGWARVVALADQPGACEVFFGDAGPPDAVQPLAPASDSIDPRDGWIDARLVFGALPSFAQAAGGTFTTSRLPYTVTEGSITLVNVVGRLVDERGATLVASRGGFRWMQLPHGARSVVCEGLCELVATAVRPPPAATAPQAPSRPLNFRRFAPWLYIVHSASAAPAVLRLNVRYDPSWFAISPSGALRHVRLDMSANGWFYPTSVPPVVVIVQMTALLQSIAEFVAILYLLWLLKAAVREPTKRER